MTTDNQTIENPDALSENLKDVFCRKTEQKSLQKIADAWHIFKGAGEHHDYCLQKFSPKQDCVIAAGYNNVDDLPSVDLIEYLKLPKFVAESSNEKVFDIIVQDVDEAVTELARYRNEVDRELQSLKASQDSKLRSAQSDLSYFADQRYQQQEKSEKLSRSILLESALLFGAFILGAGGGIWGAIIALGVMFWWRSSLYD
jgi:hypothetical protein